MCNQLGNIVTVNEANRQAERNMYPPLFYTYYWRTNKGYVRETGYVASCKCNLHQVWSKTKKGAIEKIMKG